MAYEQGIATSKEDFVDQLTTFAENNGWTIDEFDAAGNKASIHLNGIFVSFRWDAVDSGGIAVFHSLGYDQQAVSATIAAGGSGYTDGAQVLTLTGGTFVTAAQFNVTVSGGVVTSVDGLATPGQYSVIPTDPVSTSGGGGTGCTLNVTWEGVAGGLHTFDSGNGDESGAIDTERRMSDVGDSGYVNHWFFSGDEGGADYLYAVLEYEPGKFSSFVAGEMVKSGTWTGGEFCGATVYEAAFDVNDSRHNYMVDGRIDAAGDVSEAATIHVENLPNQVASGKWGVVGNFTPSQTGNDGSAVARHSLAGGAREGFLNHAIQGIPANPNNGFVPMVPFLIWARDQSSGEHWRFLGKLPHIRELNGTSLIAGEEFTIGGSETWKVFPYTRKAASGTPHSGNVFFAVRKIV